VLFRGDNRPRPFSSFDSNKPEDLWTFLEHNRQQGMTRWRFRITRIERWFDVQWPRQRGEADRSSLRGTARGQVAADRDCDISQGKHIPALSPEDEFASFELFGLEQMTQPKGSYVRDALGRGMEIAAQIGVNPYRWACRWNRPFRRPE